MIATCQYQPTSTLVSQLQAMLGTSKMLHSTLQSQKVLEFNYDSMITFCQYQPTSTLVSHLRARLGTDYELNSTLQSQKVLEFNYDS
jgi:hypothetical protein